MSLWLICTKSSHFFEVSWEYRGPSFLQTHGSGGTAVLCSGKDRAKVSSWVEFPVCNVWIQGRCQEFWRFYSREDSFLLGQNCNESTISSPVDALVLQKYVRLIIQLSCYWPFDGCPFSTRECPNTLALSKLHQELYAILWTLLASLCLEWLFYSLTWTTHLLRFSTAFIFP